MKTFWNLLKLITKIIKINKKFEKNRVLLFITEILVVAGYAVCSSTMSLITPGASINISSSTALLTSIAILITNEYISKLNIRYTKLRDSMFLNSTLTSPKTIIELHSESYVGSLHESRRNRGDISSVFRDQDNEFNKNNKTNLDSITFNRDPNLDNKLSNKKSVDGSIVEGTLLRFNQTLENFLKVSVGNYN